MGRIVNCGFGYIGPYCPQSSSTIENVVVNMVGAEDEASGSVSGTTLTLNIPRGGTGISAGQGEPTGTASSGELYIDTVTGNLYEYTGGTTMAWENVGNLKGPQGEAGTDGQDGTAATVTIGNVTTGEAGTSAQVTNSGSSSEAVLNFTIPRGEDGERGAAGPGISVGSGAPTEDAEVGELYLDTDTGDLYEFQE